MKKLTKGRWTRNEIRALRRCFANNPTASIAKVLGRPTQNVKKQASRMGLKKSARYRREVLHRRK